MDTQFCVSQQGNMIDKTNINNGEFEVEQKDINTDSTNSGSDFLIVESKRNNIMTNDSIPIPLELEVYTDSDSDSEVRGNLIENFTSSHDQESYVNFNSDSESEVCYINTNIQGQSSKPASVSRTSQVTQTVLDVDSDSNDSDVIVTAERLSRPVQNLKPVPKIQPQTHSNINTNSQSLSLKSSVCNEKIQDLNVDNFPNCSNQLQGNMPVCVTDLWSDTKVGKSTVGTKITSRNNVQQKNIKIDTSSKFSSVGVQSGLWKNATSSSQIKSDTEFRNNCSVKILNIPPNSSSSFVSPNIKARPKTSVTSSKIVSEKSPKKNQILSANSISESDFNSDFTSGNDNIKSALKMKIHSKNNVMYLYDYTKSVPPFICHICKKEFLTKKILHSHMYCHKEKIYRCKICDKTFSRRSSLHVHQVIHNDVKRYICELCGHQFNYRANLRQHYVRHTGEVPKKNQKCDACGKCFASKSELRKHTEEIHVKQKTFMCFFPGCGLWFPKIQFLHKHLLTHTVKKVHTCEMCGMEFHKQGRLTSHMKVHKKKVYSCEICQKIFRNQSFLQQHMVSVHKGDNSFHCEICGKIFDELTCEHKSSTTSSENLTCEFCGKVFENEDSLSSHKLTIHAGEKRHRCDVCGKQFAWESNLSAHVRIHKNAENKKV